MVRLIKKFIAVPLLVFAFASFTVKPVSIEEEWVCDQYKGTYRFEIFIRAKVLFPGNLCQIIQQNRKVSEQAIVPTGTDVQIRLLSSNEINQGIKFNEEVVYVNR